MAHDGLLLVHSCCIMIARRCLSLLITLRPCVVQEEPFWQESSQFTRELALQREVEIDVETVRIPIDIFRLFSIRCSIVS